MRMNEPQRLLRMLLKTPTSLLWTPDSSDNKEKADALIFFRLILIFVGRLYRADSMEVGCSFSSYLPSDFRTKARSRTSDGYACFSVMTSSVNE